VTLKCTYIVGNHLVETWQQNSSRETPQQGRDNGHMEHNVWKCPQHPASILNLWLRM